MNQIQGPARQIIAARDAQTLAEQLDIDEISQVSGRGQTLLGAGAVILNNGNARPMYFQGRFLTAEDLTRDQNYFILRQAALGRAGGSGIVAGLEVSADPGATQIIISPGHGVTPSGELVLVEEQATISLVNLPRLQNLRANFGDFRKPQAIARNLTGRFIVALSPVEYSANLIAAYPAGINQEPAAHDGDIVEATAVTLIPFPDSGAQPDPALRRAQIARRIFLENGQLSLPPNSLPLAVLSLNFGAVEWVDPYLVRREVGASHGDILGLGFAPRATREAHLLQYDRHLEYVLEQREASGRGLRFNASEHFQVLPPAGRMPAAAINPADFTQVFFPPEVDVELSFIPEDEIRLLIEESLLLPPIDLTLSGEELESTSVMVLLPVPRAQVRRLSAELQGVLSQALHPAAPNQVAKRRPIETLRTLRFSLPPILAVPDIQEAANNAWRSALAQNSLVWFARRRNLSYKSGVVSVVATVAMEAARLDMLVENNLNKLGLIDRFSSLRAGAGSSAVTDFTTLLGSRKVLDSPALTEAALSSLEKAAVANPDNAPPVQRAETLKLIETFSAPEFGKGLIRMEKTSPEFTDPAVIKSLIDSGTLASVDKLGVTVQDEARLKTIGEQVVTLAKDSAASEDAKVIKFETLKAVGDLTNILASAEASSSAAIKEAALTHLENASRFGETATADLGSAAAAVKILADPEVSAGLSRIQNAATELNDPALVKTIADPTVLPQLARVGAVITDEVQLKAITNEVAAIARSDDPKKNARIASLLNTHLKAGPR